MQNEDEIPKLKEVYEELWSDAKTLIKDMTRSITFILLSSFFVLIFSVFPISLAYIFLLQILAGNTHWLVRIFLIVSSVCSIFYMVFGVKWLLLYFRLRTRYAKLIEIEKTIED